jgi:DNA gyrase/topoisomerase IV subunit B
VAIPTVISPAFQAKLTQLHAGGKFDKRSSNSAYAFSGGLHGVGVSVTNALSTRVEVEIQREKKRWRIDFANGGETIGELRTEGDCGRQSATRDRLAKEGARAEAIEVGRFKGLGEMNPEQLRETTMDPATRRVLPVQVRDGAETETRRMFTLLMGKGEAADRRAWMEAKGDTVEADV